MRSQNKRMWIRLLGSNNATLKPEDMSSKIQNDDF